MKVQKGFIQIPLLIGIIVSIIVATGVGYGAIEYYKTSKLVNEAEQLTQEEKYNEAIEKLGVAQISWFSKTLGIKKEKINNEIEENERLFEDKSKYDKGLDEFNEENWEETIEVLSGLPESSFYYQNAQIRIKEAEKQILRGELAQEKVAKEKAEQKAREEAVKRAEEEKARKEAEEEKRQEGIARKAAEEKAKQEEMAKKTAEEKAKKEKEARKAKEKELAEKEAEEKRMNADNDGDGLTYREELKKGTSDWDSDSDGDGIIDGEDTHPAGGGRNIPQTFAWSYGGYDWTWTESIQEDWYDYYKAKLRGSHPSVEYITSDDPFIKRISKKISEGAKGNIHKTWLAVSFVQNLPYVEDVHTGYNEYPKYPIETFFEKNGDCEDTSYLAASILDAMNIGSVLILLPGHMAVGVLMDCDVAGTYYEFDGRCYYYVETTDKDWAGGEIPDRFRTTLASLINVPSGETATNVRPKHKKPCDPSTDFSGYYYDGSNYYSDSQCNYQITCLPYQDYYFNTVTESFYHDSSCTQIVVKGCYKSTDYPGYFYNSIDFYSDSQCTQEARICRPFSIYSDRYWDGEDAYWDSSCTQRVVLGCDKSVYYPGFFFDGWGYYYDYQCSQEADPY